jgi:hypothetical protein
VGRDSLPRFRIGSRGDEQLAFEVFQEKSRLKALLQHFSTIPNPREPWRVAHSLAEVLLLVVCATMADCDDFDAISAWGEAHLAFLRRYPPYLHGVPGGRWLTLLMNRIDPALFSAAFTAWVSRTWPDRPDFGAIDGKTSRLRRGVDHAASIFAVLTVAPRGRVAPCGGAIGADGGFSGRGRVANRPILQ